MESTDSESPSKPPETYDQSRKSNFDRIAGCIGALGGTDQQGQSRDIPEDILVAALESLVPTDLEVHPQTNSSRFETCDAMRAEVLAFIESRTG